jgi:iron(III) transport system substrate-binding protein
MARKAALHLLIAGLLTSIAAGCGGDREALTIYSGRSENLIGPLLERFSEETDIAIDVRYGDSTDLALLLAEEGDRTPADVFLSQSPGAIGFLAERGLLERLPADLLADVDSRYESEQGLWVGVSGRRRVLVYNRDRVDEDELPASVFDLTGPRYAGKVALAPTNASFQDFVSAMRQVAGDDEARSWLRAMAAGGAPTYANNNAIVEAVGRGEVTMGLVNHYYNERFLAEDPGLPSRNHIFPGDDLGSIVLVTAASVLAQSAHDENAERFVGFLLSREAQRYYADETFEYPLAAGVEPAEGLPALPADVGLSYDVDRLGGELEGTARMIEASGLGD